MRILLIGADGQLATSLRERLASEDVVCANHEQLDITDRAATTAWITETGPELVINTAAYNRVDEAEDNATEAFAVNALGAHSVAISAQKAGAAMVHFSTDFVFAGDQRVPYREDDTPAPLCVYGASKLAGERLVAAYAGRSYVIRTCGLYGWRGSRSKGGNFVETMLRLAQEGKTVSVVADQIVTPTSTRELADRVARLVTTGTFGLFHMSAAGECSWYEFAREIFERVGGSGAVVPTTTAAFGARARRPAYSVLDNARMRSLGIPEFRHWRQGLQEYLDERLAAPGASTSAKVPGAESPE